MTPGYLNSFFTSTYFRYFTYLYNIVTILINYKTRFGPFKSKRLVKLLQLLLVTSSLALQTAVSIVFSHLIINRHFTICSISKQLLISLKARFGFHVKVPKKLRSTIFSEFLFNFTIYCDLRPKITCTNFLIINLVYASFSWLLDVFFFSLTSSLQVTRVHADSA